MIDEMNNPNQLDLDHFQVLFDRSLDGMLFIDKGQFVKCNLAAAQMLGYDDPVHLLKLQPSEISPPTQADGVSSEEKANHLIQITLERGQHRFEWRHLKADGDPIWVEVSLTSVGTEEHQIIHVIWRDIDAKKEAEGKLFAAKTQMEEIINQFPVAIVRAETDNTSVGYFNKKFHSLFGWSLSDIDSMEKWFTHAYPDPEYRDEIITSWGDLIEMTHKLGLVTSPHPVPSNVTCKDGTVKNCMVWYHSTAGNVFGIFYDVTAQQNAEKKVAARTEELALANATKDKFFSIIAHDLRGPIGSLSVIFNEVVQEDGKLEDGLLAVVRRSTKNTYELLEDLLTWSRSQRGEVAFEPENLSLAPVVGEVFGLLLGPASHKEIVLQMAELEKQFVFADSAMTATVVRNLINNAIKFTPEGGTITVSALDQGDQIQISVADTGVGIAPSRLSKLFQLAGKSESTLGTSSESGTGLGLVLCAEFVAANRGTIGVDSVLGEGSRFWFTLPKGEAVKKVCRSGKDLLYGVLAKIQVLVAEDNLLHQETTSAVLHDLGIHFEMVGNGALALEAAQSKAYDVVLMDIDMPELNGVETTKLLRQFQKKGQWILALSSYSKVELDKLAKDTPFDGYINKPLSKIDLLTQLRPLLLPNGKKPIGR